MFDGPARRSESPKTRIRGTDAIAIAPPRTSAPGRRRRGSQRSASRPPSQLPTAMPARITPMIPVNVSRETPT